MVMFGSVSLLVSSKSVEHIPLKSGRSHVPRNNLLVSYQEAHNHGFIKRTAYHLPRWCPFIPIKDIYPVHKPKKFFSSRLASMLCCPLHMHASSVLWRCHTRRWLSLFQKIKSSRFKIHTTKSNTLAGGSCQISCEIRPFNWNCCSLSLTNNFVVKNWAGRKWLFLSITNLRHPAQKWLMVIFFLPEFDPFARVTFEGL